MTSEGIIIKALSGFYYVADGKGSVVECRARGRFRNEDVTPLVGDRVRYSLDTAGKGRVDELLPRENYFIRPAVANVNQLVILASGVNPVTDPFLIDKVAVTAERAGCGVLICINKDDLDPGDRLYHIYSGIGYGVIRTSALTGDGIEELKKALSGRISVLTGNSGVGKSSVLNALQPGLSLKVGEVSEKLGRGRHTTRHVELFSLGNGTFIADTPGFASFDFEEWSPIPKDELQHLFPEISKHIGSCRFRDCAHINEPGCAVLKAVEGGLISPSRHGSYVRMYQESSRLNPWELKA